MNPQETSFYLTDAQLESFNWECLDICVKGISSSPGFVTIEALTLLTLQRSLGLTEEPANDKILLRRMAATSARDGGCYVSPRHKIGNKLYRSVWATETNFKRFMINAKGVGRHGYRSSVFLALEQQTLKDLSALERQTKNA